jgi:predicted transcriptional regulator
MQEWRSRELQTTMRSKRRSLISKLKEGRNDRENAAALRKLQVYSTLNNEIRLEAFSLIHRAPGISFNDLATKLGLETGLLAYHIGLLKSNDLIQVSYERRGKETSKYSLTDSGMKAYRELFFD